MCICIFPYMYPAGDSAFYMYTYISDTYIYLFSISIQWRRRCCFRRTCECLHGWACCVTRCMCVCVCVCVYLLYIPIHTYIFILMYMYLMYIHIYIYIHTVEEAVQFSADMRLPASTSVQQRAEIISRLIADLGLQTVSWCICIYVYFYINVIVFIRMCIYMRIHNTHTQASDWRLGLANAIYLCTCIHLFKCNNMYMYVYFREYTY